jgi:DNA-binding LacI/PurR family transcriptional regulator
VKDGFMLRSHRSTNQLVANLTGFSTATVSRALSGQGSVKATTKARVLEKAREVGYSPNTAARALAKASVLLELCIHPQLSFIAQHYLEAIKVHLPSHVVLAHPCLDTKITNPYQILIGRFDRFSPIADSHIDGSEPRDGSPSKACIVAGGYLTLDNGSAAFALTSHLRCLGHDNILCLAAPKEDVVMQARVSGFKAALPDTPARAVVYGELSALSAYQTIRQYLEQKNEFTAVVCLSPLFIEGVLAALADEGKKIPDDISVVSFTELNGEGNHVTSIHPDPAGFAKTLLRAWQDKANARPIPSVLVDSSTTARRR